jgi:hypothetical protein
MSIVIEETPRFQKEFAKLPLDVQHALRKKMVRVEQDPNSAGKVLSVPRLHELPHRMYRAYFFLHFDQGVAQFHAVGHKNDQVRIIEALRKFSEYYRREQHNSYKPGGAHGRNG